MKLARRPGKPHFLILQAKAFWIIVRIWDVTKVHVVHILIAQIPVLCEPPEVSHLRGIAAGEVRAFIKKRHTIFSAVVKVDLTIRLGAIAIWRDRQTLVLLILDDILRSISTRTWGTSGLATRTAQQVTEFALRPLCNLLAPVHHRLCEFGAGASHILLEELRHFLRPAAGKVVDLPQHELATAQEELGPSQPRLALQLAVAELEDALYLGGGTPELGFGVEPQARGIHKEADALARAQGDAAADVCTHHIQQSSNLAKDGAHNALHERTWQASTMEFQPAFEVQHAPTT